jgi:bacterioferritin
MKGDEKVIDRLNGMLADELTAINQYMVHAEMCEDWGYQRLHEAIEKRAFDEMRHAEKLIGRILFLEGRPIVSNLNPIHIGQDVEAQLKNDAEAEREAIANYNDNIKVAVEAGDNGSRQLIKDILLQEEDHLDWLEEQLDQIEQMGIQQYLSRQIKE